MAKIIREILELVWKVLRQVLWRWLKPLLGKVLLLAIMGITIITLLVMVVVRGC